MEQTEKWLWSGKMIDCNGRVSRFYLGEKRENGSAQFLIEMLQRDGHATKYTGTAQTKSDERNLSIHFETKMEERQGELIRWTTELQLSEAGSYAKLAAYGSYQSGGNKNFLNNGVIILWQFS